MAEADCGFANGDSLQLIGPTLYVEIGFDRNYVPRSGGRPRILDVQWPALVDTGASNSSIDADLAAELRLPIADQEEWSGIGGATTVNMYLAQIHIPALGSTIYGRFAGVHLYHGGQPHRALIGREFLRRCTLTYDGKTGQVILSDD